MGSRHPLNIHSIRLIQYALNLETVMSAITALDNCLSNEAPASYNHGKVLSALFDYALYDKAHTKFNPYVYATFDCFRRNKTEISIDIGSLQFYGKIRINDGKLLDLFIHQIHEFVRGEEDTTNINNMNMLKPELFQLFPNINHVYIRASDYRGFIDYIFSLSQLLSLLGQTKVNRVDIVAYGKESSPSRASWIKKLWISSSEVIRERFSKQKFDIRFGKKKNDDTLIIEKYT